MESRRVILLTKGFLHGWLDFKPKSQLSRVRENYIIRCIENDEVQRIAQLRTLIDAIIASGIKSPEVVRLAFESYDHYRELALPYMAKKGTMALEKSTDKQQMLQRLKDMHAKNKGMFDKLKSKNEEM